MPSSRPTCRAQLEVAVAEVVYVLCGGWVGPGLSGGWGLNDLPLELISGEVEEPQHCLTLAPEEGM